MTVNRRDAVVGVFDDHGAARRAVDDLRRAGFTEGQLGVMVRDADTELRSGPADQATTEPSKWEEGAATGAVAGAGIGALWALGIAGGVLPGIGPVVAGGILASVLASAAGTAVVGGVLGALIGLGIPEEEARCYEREFHAGRTLVTVNAAGRFDEVRTIFRRHGAREINWPDKGTGPQNVQVPVRSEQVGGGSVSGNVCSPAGSMAAPVSREDVHRDRPVDTGRNR
jgi:hypothetical protein